MQPIISKVTRLTLTKLSALIYMWMEMINLMFVLRLHQKMLLWYQINLGANNTH